MSELVFFKVDSVGIMTGNVKEVIEITRKTLDTLSASVKLYTQVLGETIPWKVYDDSIEQLFLYTDYYPVGSGKILGQIKYCFLKAQDTHFSATQDIGFWCGVALDLLKLCLLVANNSEMLDAQKRFLMELLDKGVTEMEKTDFQIGNFSKNLNLVAGLLVEINTHLTVDKLIKQLKASIDDIESTRQERIDVRKNMREMKEIAESTKYIINVDDMKELHKEIVGSVNDLISLCKKCRERLGINSDF